MNISRLCSWSFTTNGFRDSKKNDKKEQAEKAKKQKKQKQKQKTEKATICSNDDLAA